ncbi:MULTISPECIES: sigma-54 dependent transcriptional regulator [Caballeronia]|jgi:DNA-binding NtrC family response regulator|uniref:Fis family transcriptional regulator n=1 Tax=Caballeronia zhejiangensis TaxID=871203 RepID=A0A656QFQ2_9BURK|nr:MULTISPECIES: sigma-54 dependent transcriptional regulator [Caballeronia]EKS73088.1 sigma-54 dependent transcription regulator [Burkholderia sp. SJ98]KDR28611.1 Fis family transcriptional regulator [Caballeronia zhejiangensis]MCG7402847.1 sigma-54 dependent transcriptional regulator [Caballeronia zhejiangensis]MCI1046164.1 sigma-54-dependent Fis family transcriptional regulator [Caballeronia zhejiangensis]MDR5765762.1 sigma-54 dependent transcriptional regulator [Caballeronia sp. LZ028]
MDVARRQLIYVTRDPSETLCARFEERGWHIEIVANARDTRKALRSDLATGGLLDLSSHFESHELAAFESSLTMTNVGWVAATVAGQLEDAAVRRLIRDYCFDYVTLPTSNDRIVDSVGHAYGMVSLHDAASNDARSEGRAEGEMVGSCDAMLALFRSIRKVAMTDAPVFISGESGTGKELTAVAIHERSARRDQPFVAINCGAIPAHLLQSELFGYERGAFTGANQRKIGRVEAANGGTLFLDEIGDLPLESQASLLRFLQERKVERLGGHGSTPVDVRIISATHVDMQTAMIEGRFRADLYHRLCVLQIDEPPLRARGKDIELLAKHMLDRFKKDASRRLRGFSPDAIAAIHNYGWPGNVRELINRVRRAIVMSEGRQITARDLELGEYVEVAPVSLAQAREAAERQAIELALLRHRGRLGDAAHELGISRVTLYRLLSAHGMRHIEVDAPSEHATRG